MNKIEYTLVAGLHGNELAPYFALQEDNLPVILGNPRAAFAGKRFIERDLNASFGTSGNSIEERRARELLELITPGKLVLDFHSFSCDSPPFAVIVEREMLPVARALGLKRIVLMSHDIKSGHALISHRRGISIEAGKHGSQEAYEYTRQIAGRLSGGAHGNEIEVYEVFGIINEPGDCTNFAEHSEGFVPILSGEVAYAHHGLKARRIA